MDSATRWHSCALKPILTWDDTNGSLGNALFNDAASTANPELLTPVRFEHETLPMYPGEAVASLKEGNATLVVDVGPNGKPANVRVFSSAGDIFLDNAATQSAWLSTYPITNEPRTYVAEFDFLLHIPGVKYPSNAATAPPQPSSNSTTHR